MTLKFYTNGRCSSTTCSFFFFFFKLNRMLLRPSFKPSGWTMQSYLCCLWTRVTSHDTDVECHLHTHPGQVLRLTTKQANVSLQCCGNEYSLSLPLPLQSPGKTKDPHGSSTPPCSSQEYENPLSQGTSYYYATTTHCH